MRKWILVGGTVLLAVILYRLFISSYYIMVMKDGRVESQWVSVEMQYRQRLDLIPELINLLKGVADFEESLWTEVNVARAQAAQVTVDPENITDSTLQQFHEVQQNLGVALNRLLVVTARYPDLQTNENFLELKAQLVSMEDTIAAERKKYNDLSGDFNAYISRFPRNVLADMYGVNRKSGF